MLALEALAFGVLGCAGPGCGRGETQPQPARSEGPQAAAPEPGARAEAEPGTPAAAAARPAPAPYTLPTATTDAWPSVPTGTTDDGWVWQTIRHGAIHVHLAVPPTYQVELGTHSTRLPVVRLHGPGTELEVTYSSGTARFITTGRMPPNVTQVRREASDQNVAMAYDDAQGTRRVGAWTRAARCELMWATDSNQDEAFRVCQTMRHPPPGALLPPRTRGSNAPFPPQPEHATLDTLGTVRRILTGHFSVQVNRRGPCPSLDVLAERYGPDLEARPVALPHGPALRGQLYSRLGDERWPAGVVIWATRAQQCCTATIPGEPAPTEAQVTYVAEVCDALGLPREESDMTNPRDTADGQASAAGAQRAAAGAQR